MNAEVDASRVFDHEPIEPSVENKQHLSVQYCGGNLPALELLLAQSQRELQECVYGANFAVWGYWNTSSGAPTRKQAAELLMCKGHLFKVRARQAHELRSLCAKVAEAVEAAKAKAVEDMHERGRKSQEADDLAAFEAHEARDKQRRFDKWMARRK